MAVRISNVSVLSICRHIITIASLLREFSHLGWVGYYFGIMADEKPICPDCGSVNVYYRKTYGNWRCNRCGYANFTAIEEDNKEPTPLPVCPECGSEDVWFRMTTLGVKRLDSFSCNSCGSRKIEMVEEDNEHAKKGILEFFKEWWGVPIALLIWGPIIWLLIWFFVFYEPSPYVCQDTRTYKCPERSDFDREPPVDDRHEYWEGYQEGYEDGQYGY